MELNKIMTMFLLSTSIFFSCTEETAIEPIEGNLAADVSVVFTVGDVKTKAYPNATDGEVKLNDAYVALYNSDGSFIEGHSISSPLTSSEEITIKGNDKETSYTAPLYSTTFNNIRTGKDGKNIYAVVVANAGIKSGSISGTVEGKLNDQQLVKAGKSEVVTLKPATAETDPTSITVPMTQLSARIDFAGVTVEGGGTSSSFIPKKVTFAGGNNKTDIAIYDNTKVENTAYALLENISEDWKSAPITFYTYESSSKEFSPQLIISGSYSSELLERDYTIDIVELLAAQGMTLTKGHLYTITGNLSSHNLTIKWEVVDAGSIKITVPNFE